VAGARDSGDKQRWRRDVRTAATMRNRESKLAINRPPVSSQSQDTSEETARPRVDHCARLCWPGAGTSRVRFPCVRGVVIGCSARLFASSITTAFSSSGRSSRRVAAAGTVAASRDPGSGKFAAGSSSPSHARSRWSMERPLVHTRRCVALVGMDLSFAWNWKGSDRELPAWVGTGTEPS
jgi:hypothetical protein